MEGFESVERGMLKKDPSQEVDISTREKKKIGALI